MARELSVQEQQVKDRIDSVTPEGFFRLLANRDSLCMIARANRSDAMPTYTGMIRVDLRLAARFRFERIQNVRESINRGEIDGTAILQVLVDLEAETTDAILFLDDCR